MKLEVKKIHPEAKLPNFAHIDDAGMDLYTTEPVSIDPGEQVQIPTGIAVAIPSGYVGLIWDKSGLAQVKALKSLGGVVDAGYRGEIFVGLVNLGTKMHTFQKGDKVAQILIQAVERLDILEVEELDDTIRADGGFGSTGT